MKEVIKKYMMKVASDLIAREIEDGLVKVAHGLYDQEELLIHLVRKGCADTPVALRLVDNITSRLSEQIVAADPNSIPDIPGVLSRYSSHKDELCRLIELKRRSFKRSLKLVS